VGCKNIGGLSIPLVYLAAMTDIVEIETTESCVELIQYPVVTHP